MTKRLRSPSYPSIPLNEAIEFVEKIHKAVHQSVIDREAAVKEMGYSGLTGRSGKLIAALSQYGLVEKAGKGDVRVTQTAVDILHPDPSDPDCRKNALVSAARFSDLFDSLMERFPDGVTENVLSSYLTREGFAAIAIPPTVSSYMETCQYLKQENAYDSHGHSTRAEPESELNIDPASQRTNKAMNMQDNISPSRDVQAFAGGGQLTPHEGGKLNTVRVTVDGPKLHIHGGILDLKGVAKLRRELDAYATLLELNAENEEDELGSADSDDEVDIVSGPIDVN